MRVAVVGLGSMGNNHARVYSELPDAELVAVADIDRTLAQSAAEKYHARAYTDYSEMLKKEQPEAVSIAVPTAMHEEAGMVALEVGANVLIEKPIASTEAGGQRLIEKAAKARRQLMVGHIVRFNPAIQALKLKLMAGQLGRIFQVVCRRAGPFPARIRDVGVVIDLAPHDVDIMRFLIGSDPVRVYAETQQQVHTEHEDLLWGTLRFSNGVIGGLEINWLTPTKLREVLVVGERGMFRVDDLTQDLYFFENAQVSDSEWSAYAVLKGVSEGSMTRYAIPRYEPLKAELQQFLGAIQRGASVPITGQDGLKALKISLALVQSGLEHRSIDIP
jgi:predicted dehydrogenase